VLDKKAVLPFVVFITLVGVLYTSVSLASRSPVIEELSPQTARSGEILSIHGRHFGESRGSSRVRVAGKNIPTAVYLDWSDSRIRLRIPAETSSGLVYVITPHGSSSGVLFTNADHLPEVRSFPNTHNPGDPAVFSVTPDEAAIGSIITIEGRHFGRVRGTGYVEFLWHGFAGNRDETHSEVAGTLVPQEFDDGYRFWSEQEIRVRVPDGAVSGWVRVVTDRGKSQPVPFAVRAIVGTKSFLDLRQYAFSREYKLSRFTTRMDDEDHSNFLYIWIPEPQHTPDQRNLRVLDRLETHAERVIRSSGVTGYYFEDLTPFDRVEVRDTYLMDRYAVHTSIVPERVPTRYRTEDRLYHLYTVPDTFIPSDHDAIRNAASRATGRQTNPYRKAELLFNHVLSRFDPDPERRTGVLDGLEHDVGDAFVYAGYYTATLRASGIPARMVSGFLILDDDTAVEHHWSEFYLEDFGWVPADPSLADGLHNDTFSRPEEFRRYYLGNIDNRRITFSVGVIPVRPMHPDGRGTVFDRAYSLQTGYEETRGNLTGYIRRSGEVVILGDYR
jgi:hypothetical protein